MKKPLPSLLLALCLSAPALADEVKIPSDSPVAAITFPEEWEASSSDSYITAKSKDGKVNIAIDVTNAQMPGPSNDKAFTMLKTRHIKADLGSWKDNKKTMNGMNVIDNALDARDEEKSEDLKLSLISVEVTKEKGILVVIWGTAEALKEHEEELSGIMESIKAAK